MEEVQSKHLGQDDMSGLLTSEELSSLFSELFYWKNTAKAELIPVQIRPVVNEVIEAIKDVYGHELNGALYLHGSSVAGGFRLGSSDIDGVWIADDELDETHRDRRIARLEQISKPAELGYLDIIAMPKSELADMGRKSAIFACGYNGVQIAGNKAYDLSAYLPKTRADYFSCQYARFGYIIELCRRGYELDTLEQRSPRSLAKSLARAIFHTRYAKGGQYQQSLALMPDALCLSGHEAEAEEVLRYVAMSQRTMTKAEKSEVFSKADTMKKIFEQIVEHNPSAYGRSVREWLREVS